MPELSQSVNQLLRPAGNPLRKIAIFILATFLFAIAYSQSPLYTSNQNQYFLHGLASAGFGTLRQDWLANTRDPTPVFSALVEITYRFTHSGFLYYVYYAILMGIYLFSMFGIADGLYDLRSSRTKTILFLGLFTVIHSAGLRYIFSRLFSSNWAFILEDGVADQRMLGPVFQPSSFGVLIALSVYLFLKSKPYPAILIAVLAAWVHPTYLLSAAVLTVAFMIVMFRERREIIRPVLLGLTALIAVAPVVLFVFLNFGSLSPGVAEEARKILVEYRIPHHAIVSQWLDATTLVKIILVVTALVLARGTRIWAILAITTFFTVVLTLLQVVSKSYALALIFPWRLSIFIVPVSVTIILGYLVAHIGKIPGFETPVWERVSWVASGLLITCAVLAGGFRFIIDLGRKAQEPERAVESYIYTHHLAGEIFLFPTKLEDFRLLSGAPAYVDFKSIPYQNQDVLEWYRRVRLADRFYKHLDCTLLGQIITEGGVSHVVVETDGPKFTCLGGSEVYHDPYFVVYQVTGK